MVSNPSKPGFPPWGYMLVDLHHPPANIAAALKGAKVSTYIRGFKEVGAAEDDVFRCQSRVGGKLSPALADIIRHISYVTSTLAANYCPQLFAFIHSRAGGDVQESHKHYTEADVAADVVYPGSVPASTPIA